LSGIADKLRYSVQYLLRHARNKKFEVAHPGFIFPPAYFIYETYTLDYKDYFEDGKQTAAEIIDLFRPYIDLQQPRHLLDWGCGPARVVRHIPALLSGDSRVFGCDYNQKYIQWNDGNITGVSFIKNEIDPPVLFEEAMFDGVYGLSIFTHLSERSHFLWIEELYRLLKPGGILLVTTQGEKFTHKLLPAELLQFEKGQLLIRDFEKEGHRMYSAFQPELFMKNLLQHFRILRFIPGGSADSVHEMQDTWIAQKL
jgi:SAM-dependent methyltransferase